MGYDSFGGDDYYEFSGKKRPGPSTLQKIWYVVGLGILIFICLSPINKQVNNPCDNIPNGMETPQQCQVEESN